MPDSHWLIGGAPRPPSLILQSRRSRWILNHQIQDISAYEANLFPKYKDEYPDAGIRSDPDPLYNCHGMTFASRRTGIHDPAMLHLILEDDNYSEVAPKDVLPGDVIIYFSNDGDLEHSGIVVSGPGPLMVPLVCSKWGKYCEVVHLANRCPYSYERPVFYRVKP